MLDSFESQMPDKALEGGTLQVTSSHTTVYASCKAISYLRFQGTAKSLCMVACVKNAGGEEASSRMPGML